jgi:hypothetical protein
MGRQIEDNADLWANDTKKADDRVVLLKVRDRVTAALDEVRFKVHLEKLQGLADAKLSGKVERAVEVLSLKVGAAQNESRYPFGERCHSVTALVVAGLLWTTMRTTKPEE